MNRETKISIERTKRFWISIEIFSRSIILDRKELEQFLSPSTDVWYPKKKEHSLEKPLTSAWLINFFSLLLFLLLFFQQPTKQISLLFHWVLSERNLLLRSSIRIRDPRPRSQFVTIGLAFFLHLLNQLIDIPTKVNHENYGTNGLRLSTHHSNTG